MDYGSMDKFKHKTLGTNAIPSNYKITFEPDMKRFRFLGKEEIRVRLQKKTRSIKLNVFEIKVKSARVRSGKSVQNATSRINETQKELTIGFKNPLSGEITIEIEFEGVLNDKMYGFYRSSYEKNGRKNYLLTTQFEAADARAAFPCFDEPAFKATFDITLAIDKKMEGISNMPVKSTTFANGKKTVTFKTTPRMSTYLLYLGVGNYDVLSGKLGRIKISILTVPGKRAYAKMALDYAKKFVSYFERYFGVKYPLPKLDLLAIPDFSAGAMENWGAMAFREAVLLGDEKLTPITVKQRIAEVIAHELAHQWFGDLVTMRWWNDLWLNESFATFMSYKALAATFPEWNMQTQYFDEVVATAFSADALKSTHPISVNVSTPEEIDQIFDSISYEKGGTVLHMLENYATEEIFRQGLHLYLKKNAYGNATKYDLWGAIDKAGRSRRTKVNVSKVAGYWIDNPGYPIINVNSAGGKTELRQNRFLLVDAPVSRREVWPIPLPYANDRNEKGGYMMMSGESASIAGAAKWVKLNQGQHYLYRTRYPGEMLKELGKRIRAKKIKGTDSWGIENDLFILARSGKIPLNSYLNFVENYCLDGDYPLNLGVSSHIEWFYSTFEDKKQAERIKRLSIKYHARVLSRLGWHKRPADTNTDVMLRSAAIAGLGHAGHEPTIRKVLLLFSDVAKGKQIDANLKGAVYGIAAWTGDNKRYKTIVNLYKKAVLPDDKRRLLQSLGMFRDEAIVRSTLKFAFSKDVRLQDSFMLPAIISSNPTGKKLILAWTKKNWRFLMKTYDSGTHMLERFVVNLGNAQTEREKKEIESFFSKKGNTRGDIKLRTRQTIERIQANINLLEANSA